MAGSLPGSMQDTAGHKHEQPTSSSDHDAAASEQGAPSPMRVKMGSGALPAPHTGPAPSSNPSASDRAYGPWHAPAQGQWTSNMNGHKSDPVNLYVHGSLHELLQAFERGGWTVAAKGGFAENAKYLASAAGEEAIAKPAHAVSHGLTSAWDFVSGHHDKAPSLPDPFHHGVESMPMSDQQLAGHMEVASLEKGNDPTGGRHHFRIFATGQRDAEGRHVWAIAASRDVGIVFDRNKPETGFTTHVVDPDTDGERDLVLQTLEAAGKVEQVDLLRIKFGSRKDGTTSHGAYDVIEGK